MELVQDFSVLLLDEGDLAFSSKDAMQREQKKLIKIAKIIRQKNFQRGVCLAFEKKKNADIKQR